MKTDTMLLIGGGAALLYFMTRQPKDEAQSSGGGGSIISIPGLGGGSSPLPDMSSITDSLGKLGGMINNLGDITQGTFGAAKAVGDSAASAAGLIEKINKAVADGLAAWQKMSSGTPPAIPEVPNPLKLPDAPPATPGPTDTTTPDSNSGAARDLLGLKVGALTGWSIFSKFAIPALIKAVPSLGVKTGLRFVPGAGWVYAALDAAFTAWEATTGNRIAGPWLGEMEVVDSFGLTHPKVAPSNTPGPHPIPSVAATPASVAIQAGATQAQAGRPEAIPQWLPSEWKEPS